MRHVRHAMPDRSVCRERRSRLGAGKSSGRHRDGALRARAGRRGTGKGRRTSPLSSSADREARGKPVARGNVGRGARHGGRTPARRAGALRFGKRGPLAPGRPLHGPVRSLRPGPRHAEHLQPLRHLHPERGSGLRLGSRFGSRRSGDGLPGSPAHRAVRPQRAGGHQPPRSSSHHRGEGQGLPFDRHGRAHLRQCGAGGYLLPDASGHGLRHEPCRAQRTDRRETLRAPHGLAHRRL